MRPVRARGRYKLYYHIHMYRSLAKLIRAAIEVNKTATCL